MRKTIILILLAATVITLTGCEKGEKEEYMKEFIFLEKTRDYSNPSLILESIEDENYYLVEIDNYNYDNSQLKKGDVVELNSISNKKSDSLANVFFILNYGKSFAVRDEDVFIYNEWSPLFTMKRYSKENE